MLATMTLSGLGVATALKVPFQNFSKSCFSSSWKVVVLPWDPRDSEAPQGPSWSERGGCISASSLQTESPSVTHPTVSLHSHTNVRTHDTGCCSGTVQVLNQTEQSAADALLRLLFSQQQVNVSERLSALHSWARACGEGQKLTLSN